MARVEFIPFLLTNASDIFSIRIDDDPNTEIEKFLIMFKDTGNPYLQSDLESILKAISNISENGVLESFFRPEGKYSDRLVALPVFVRSRDKTKVGAFRLYCIRVSNRLLIVGGGGLKASRAYQEDEQLLKHVTTLQAIDKTLFGLEREGLRIEEAVYNLTIEID